MALEDDDDHGYLTVSLPIDKATVEWLDKLSAVTGDRPEALIASMLQMIRVDDEAAHRQHLH